MAYVRGKKALVFLTTESASAGIKDDGGTLARTTVTGDMAIKNAPSIVDVSVLDTTEAIKDVLTVEYDPAYESEEHDTFNQSALPVLPERRKHGTVTITLLGKDALYGALFKQAPYGVDDGEEEIQSDLKDMHPSYGYRVTIYDGSKLFTFAHMRLTSYGETPNKEDTLIQEIQFEGYQWYTDLEIGTGSGEAGGVLEVE